MGQMAVIDDEKETVRKHPPPIPPKIKDTRKQRETLKMDNLMIPTGKVDGTCKREKKAHQFSY